MGAAELDGLVAAAMAQRDGVLARRLAEELGMGRAMVQVRKRAGLLREPYHGVLVATAVAPSWRQALRVATLAGAGAVASHRSAARLHRLDGFLSEDVLEVSVLARRRLAVDGVVVHRVASLEDRDIITIDGLATTGLARTLADLGSVCPVARVRQALDDARRRGARIAWLRETAERLHRPGQRGTGTLVRLLDEAASDGRVPDSWFERLVEACVASPLLPPLVRQHVVRDRHGRFVARLDAAFPDLRLGIEAHSRAFHTGAPRERADEDRDLVLAALGWEVLYIGWQQLRAPTELRRVVEAAALARATPRS